MKVILLQDVKTLGKKGEIVEIPFAISMTRPDKMAKLEAAILSPLSKFGVTLQKRDI